MRAPRIIRLCEHLLEVLGGELLEYDWMHDLLLALLRGLAHAGAARWSIEVEPAYRDQDEPEAADLVQQPVQAGLIGYRAGEDRLAAVAADLQALEQAAQCLSRDPSTRIS